MIQEAVTQVQQQNPTLLLVVAGLASTLTIIAKGLMDLLKKNYRQSAKGDRRELTAESHVAELAEQMTRLSAALGSRADDIKRLEADLTLMHARYHDLSNKMAGMMAQMELILKNRIKTD